MARQLHEIDEYGYSTLQICKAFNIERGRLREWIDRSYIEPSIKSEGQGTKAVFTAHDIYLLEVFRKLVDIGIKREMLATYMKTLRQDLLDSYIYIEECDYDDDGNPCSISSDYIYTSIRNAKYFIAQAYDNKRKASIAYLLQNLVPVQAPKQYYEKRKTTAIGFDIGIIIDLETIRNEVNSLLKNVKPIGTVWIISFDNDEVDISFDED